MKNVSLSALYLISGILLVSEVKGAFSSPLLEAINIINDMTTSQESEVKIKKENKKDECPTPVSIQKNLLQELGISYLANIPSNKEITIAVIDTGINPYNKYLRGQVKKIKPFTKNNDYGINFIDNSGEPYDNHEHGSHIAGLILAINPKAKILPIKYYKKGLTGTESAHYFTQAIKAAIEAEVDIINLSGGGPEQSPEEKKLIKLAEEKGILIVAAAGNDQNYLNRFQSHKSYYPANYGTSNIITVMSNNKQNYKSNYSNWGNTIVDVSVLGEGILSYNKHDPSNTSSCTSRLNGTSQSTAIISGLSSLLMAYNSDLSPELIKHILIETSNKYPQLEKENKASGVVNFNKAINYTKSHFNKEHMRKISNYFTN